ncbi:MAG: bifunctional 4-hydroxy-2-oxoglutarate aldolase/2-dehydro-3-deoxy-phosphogluconate aldolase [Microbacteriaceae bacterium]|jgi:2-dehydro-3-deoxyphosphogluconate aldolase/(4S)-4-hydroxy-2-oxoglutarate aldolase|nr:MAG: bifunctional 4-hydroxy-2-oxoglutarate aldolase/2-dehydro-3-deoxy-phosphogluconate aldolase [Microbacteriaceae bacterium]
MTRPALPALVADARIMVVARRLGADAYAALESLAAAGEPVVFEVTLDDPAAVEIIARLREAGHVVGAGTVLSVQQVDAALAAGARFLVSPYLDEDVVRHAVAKGAAMVPGAMTPSEIARAWSLGASAVKVFPASVTGVALFRELRGPLGHIPLMPTGGIGPDNAGEFIAHGAFAVGVGSWLTGGAPDGIATRWAQLRTVVGDGGL